MAVEGRIALPRQVITEVSEITHPDVPGVWASGIRGQLQHPLDADYEHISHVMSVASNIVDVNKRNEDADPWVLALALQIRDSDHTVCIVTEDTVDRSSISIKTACRRLMLDCCSVSKFLTHCGITIRKEKEKG